MEFLSQTRCFKIIINSLSGDSFQNTSIYWAPIVPAVASNVGFINGTTLTLTPATVVTPFTSANPVTVAILSAKLKQMGQYAFTLQLADTTTYTANALQYTSEFRMAGKWLKLFGLDPGMKDVFTTNMQISCKTDTPTPALTLQVHGYDNINIHSAIAKSVHASNRGLNYNYVTSTNILWYIQIVYEPFDRTYFSSMNTAGKCPISGLPWKI